MANEFNPQKIRLIVGLGNPGDTYENTYHNVGILFLETLIEKKEEKKLFSRIPRKNFLRMKKNGKILIKTETFMNESGKAVKSALRYEKAKPEEMLVAHDDNDLPLGTFKIDFDRGPAGHNGVLSLITALKTKKFWRLRIGIQKTVPHGRKKAGEFVLSKISPADKKIIQKTCENAAQLLA